MELWDCESGIESRGSLLVISAGGTLTECVSRAGDVTAVGDRATPAAGAAEGTRTAADRGPRPSQGTV